MLMIISLITPMLLWSSAMAGVPPSDGECKPKFTTVNPLKLMDLWHVMEHTENLGPVGTDCMVFKFGRRASFNANFRVDIVGYYADEDSDMLSDFPILRGDVASEAQKPFQVGSSGAPVFPPVIMITDFDKENGCMAVWTCQDMGGGIQKASWIVCKSTDVDPDIIENLKKSVAEHSEIDPKYFVATKHSKCII